MFSSRKLFRKQGFNEEVENTNCRISVVKVTSGVAQEEDIIGHKIRANNPRKKCQGVARIYDKDCFETVGKKIRAKVRGGRSQLKVVGSQIQWVRT